ncbi:MAG: helix-turn-helix transcriptional regulator [Clostridia bacterium]|jgi:transcriptional regulator with XRE-family HTH domain|nr:helix-turn-helix transcriptional regulator [Clostridia bacterium]
MSTVGERIKSLRESKGLTSKNLAEILNINQSTYSKLENNKKSISVSELKKITEFFGVDADFIIGSSKSEEEMILYMKREKNISQEDIDEVEKILAMMDEATTLYNMKKRIW